MAAMAASFPITASADSRIDRLERQVAELSERVRQLEQQTRAQHIIIENRQSKAPVYACNVSVFGHKQPFGSVPLSGHSYPFFDPKNYPQVSVILELLY